ncbi:MAG: class I SAM-dependent methyltransferase [Chloroflexota bacterium]
MKESINFDRAAGFYDATRVLPGAAAGAITAELLRQIELAGADRLLEIGIGTGRMARPLMDAGVRVVGVDISREMMGRLLAQLPSAQAAPQLLLGDATALPLADASFKAALMVHVFHLVASAAVVAAEVRRVLEPGGVLLHQERDADEETAALWKDSDDKWRQLLDDRGFQRRVRPQRSDIKKVLQDSGATLESIPVAETPETSTVEEELERIRIRSQSWTWEVPEDKLRDALPEYEAWLRDQVKGGRWTDHTTQVIEVIRWD